MAKNLNSISFTVLLLVLVMASTGIFKSEAAPCGANPCSTSDAKVFLSECGASPYTGTNADCCNCCKSLGLASPPLCWAVVEGTSPPHCHCYQKKV